MISLLNIVALLLVLPLQLASFVQTVNHIQTYAHKIHALAHDHKVVDEDHDHHGDAEARDPGDPTEHRHSEGEPFHCHAKELLGSSLHMSITASLQLPFAIIPFSEKPAAFDFENRKGRVARLTLFRPPIG